MLSRLRPGEMGLLTALVRDGDSPDNVRRALDRVRMHLSDHALNVASILFQNTGIKGTTNKEIEQDAQVVKDRAASQYRSCK